MLLFVVFLLDVFRNGYRFVKLIHVIRDAAKYGIYCYFINIGVAGKELNSLIKIHSLHFKTPMALPSRGFFSASISRAIKLTALPQRII